MRKIVIILLLSFFTVQAQHKGVENKFFPEEEYEINTPAFQKNKFTNYKTMMVFLEDLKSKKPNLFSIKFIGTSQKGDSIPMVTVSTGSSPDKIKVFLQGGLHGNEPASTEGMLYLLERIGAGDFDSMLDKFELGMIPMANIDGYCKVKRYNHKNLDLNRDQIAFVAHESPYLKRAFIAFNPDVAVDFHEYNPYRSDYVSMGEQGITSAYDALFLNSGNLNVHPALREINNTLLVPNAEKALESNGRKTNIYISPQSHHGVQYFNFASTAARSSSSNYGLSNCASLLMEIRGVGLYRTSFKRRVRTTFILASDFIKTAVENKDKIKAAVAKANEETVARQQEIAIKTKRPYEPYKLEYIDLLSREYVEMEIVIRNSLNQSPTLVRERPVAYVLMPTEIEAVKKLEILGVKVEKTASDQTIVLQTYEVEKYVQTGNELNRIFPVAVKTKLVEKEVMIPAGSYVVYMNQENANYAAVALEPEGGNSFVYFNVIEVIDEVEIPCFRLMNDVKLK